MLGGHCDRLRKFRTLLFLIILNVFVFCLCLSDVNCRQFWYFGTLSGVNGGQFWYIGPLQLLIAENFCILALFQALIADNFGIFNTFGKNKYHTELEPMTSGITSR